VSRFRRIVVALVLVPLAIVLIAFAVANREIVTVSLDPFDSAQPAWSVRMPLFVLIFVFLIGGVLLGGFAAWLRQRRHRRASRALRLDLAGLRREIEILNSRLETQGESRESGATRMPLPPPGM
jgi:uncharacterized integral membrane protein